MEWECEKLLTVEDSFMELGALSPAMTIETEVERERERVEILKKKVCE